MSKLVQAWVMGHPAVDFLLQVALGAVLVLVTLLAAAGSLYWLWFVFRLCGKENRSKFIESPIPALRKVRTPGGLEAELSSGLREGLPKFEAGTTQALEVLTNRLEVLEKSVQTVEYQVGRFEDVSGRLPTHKE